MIFINDFILVFHVRHQYRQLSWIGFSDVSISYRLHSLFSLGLEKTTSWLIFSNNIVHVINTG